MKNVQLHSQLSDNRRIKGTSLQFLLLYILALILLMTINSIAAIKTSITSGNWENASIWVPRGVPTPSDNIIIGRNTVVTTTADQSIESLVLNQDGEMIIGISKRLTINGGISLDGKLNMNKGMLTMNSVGSLFYISPTGTFIWDPGINTSEEATLFSLCNEQFDIGSTLIVKNWYNYSIPFCQNINGNFGNLELNSPSSGNSIVEWNQQNLFESHKIFGTLTIDQGWITLDKSGSITNTTFGNIYLKNVNSTFYGHNGNHPGTFSIHCSNITNDRGTFYGLNDGNGNVIVQTFGNFSNSGNVKIINNTGVIGVSNGNATLSIEGSCSQTSGDFRIIYNIASTNSGTFNARFGNLTLDGGIFMGQTACHTGNQQSILRVNNEFKINFRNPGDKFRGTSLSSISGISNNMKLNLIVGGNFKIDGNVNSEVTSSASAGQETVSINGNMEVSGCTTSLNYGAPSSSHDNQLNIAGNLIMNGGDLSLSKNSGLFSGSISNKLLINGGLLSIKNANGSSTFTVNRGLIQSGGDFIFHHNISNPTSDNIIVSINKLFIQSGGNINMDDNSQSSAFGHQLKIFADTMKVSGNGTISRTVSNNLKNYGIVNYEKEGTVHFNRTGTSHQIRNIIQNIESRCKIEVSESNFQVCSFSQPSERSLNIVHGGSIQMNNSQIVSNDIQGSSTVYVDSLSKFGLTNPFGFYDSNNKGAISSNGTINYELHPFSIVEYNGKNNQVLTGIPFGSSFAFSKYGILRIDLPNAFSNQVNLNNDLVFIRTRLELANGPINLNNKTLNIENGAMNGIRKIKGFIISEGNSTSTPGYIRWMNINSENHEIPFGTKDGKLVPITFKPVSGIGQNFSASTRSTEKDNQPYPSSNIIFPGGSPYANDQVIDRWWNFNAPGVVADITLTYDNSENSLSPTLANEQLNIIQWNGRGWNITNAKAYGSTNKPGTIFIASSNMLSSWTVASVNVASIDIDASLMEDAVRVNWHIQSEKGIDHFIVEKSSDETNFIPAGTILASFDGKIKDFSFDDTNFSNEFSFYRLKQVSPDGNFIYSKIAKVEPIALKNGFEIKNVSPNPFTSSIQINVSSINSQSSKVSILSSDGKLKYNKVEILESGENTIQIDNLDGLPAGNYILMVESEKGRNTKKIIKN